MYNIIVLHSHCIRRLFGRGAIIEAAVKSGCSKFLFCEQLPFIGSRAIDFWMRRAPAFIKHCCSIGLLFLPPLAFVFRNNFPENPVTPFHSIKTDLLSRHHCISTKT